MKKYVAVCATLATLAWAGVAAAATPQGKLTGSATIGTGGPLIEISTQDPVIDGGTSYVGLENDKSGNCSGDSGTIIVRGTPTTVSCAHYVASSRCCNAGSPKMRLAFEFFPGFWEVDRITDNGASPDTFGTANGGGGVVSTFAQARAWVNKGAIGGGEASFFFVTPITGNYTITASQT